MIYILQLIYIKEGQENVFHQFEDIAIPIISKYNGRLLLRVRPDENSFIKYRIERPYEIHLVEFDRRGSRLYCINFNRVHSIYYFGRGLDVGLLNKLDSVNAIQKKFLTISSRW